MCPKFNQAKGMCEVYAKTPDRAERRWQTWLDAVGYSHVENYCLHSDKWRSSCANYNRPDTPPKSSGGCYVATCVYGSYDCQELWVLRRYRDTILADSWLGRRFIRMYYSVSPKIVEVFGNKKWFNNFFKPIIANVVERLNKKGIDNAPYEDK